MLLEWLSEALRKATPQKAMTKLYKIIVKAQLLGDSENLPKAYNKMIVYCIEKHLSKRKKKKEDYQTPGKISSLSSSSPKGRGAMKTSSFSAKGDSFNLYQSI